MRPGVLGWMLGTALAAWGALPAAGSAPAAGAPGAFLKLGVDARAMGLGGAYVAVPGDVSCVYWNPAGLATVCRQSFMATYTLLTAGGEYSQIAYALPLSTFGFPGDARSCSLGAGPDGTLALSLIRLVAAYDIEARQVDSLNPNYLFSDVEGSYGLAFALPVGYGLAAGIGVKGLYHLLDQSNAGGWGVDIGVQWQAAEWLNLGLAVRDAYSCLEWNTQFREVFPPTLRLGAAYRLPVLETQQLLLTADAEQSLSLRPVRLRAGAEYGFAEAVVVRAGYADGALAAGAGLRVPGISWGRLALRLDYAALQDSLEGWDHWITLKLDF